MYLGIVLSLLSVKTLLISINFLFADQRFVRLVLYNSQISYFLQGRYRLPRIVLSTAEMWDIGMHYINPKLELRKYIIKRQDPPVDFSLHFTAYWMLYIIFAYSFWELQILFGTGLEI